MVLASAGLATGCYAGLEPGQDEGADELGTDGSEVGSDAGESGESGESSDGDAGTEAGEPEPGIYADGIAVDRVEINQAVGIDLAMGGQAIAEGSRVAPVIAGRPGLVRASWSIDAGFEPRMIQARLILTADEGTTSYVLERYVGAAPGPNDWGSFDGVFTWELDADAITGSTAITVELLEDDGSRAGADASEGARFPAAGGLDLAAMDGPMTVKVMIVPATDPNVDSTPITISDAFLDELRVNLYNFYPVRDVELQVHEPLLLNACYDGPSVMAQLSALRNAEGLGDEWYYHAIVGNSNESYCNTGGYSWLLEDEFPGNDRVSFSINHWGESPNNWTHELGHCHGRPHTWEDGTYQPAAADGPDCGRRTTWGYALLPGPHPKANEWDFPALQDLDDWLVPPTEGLGLSGYCLGHSDYDTWGPALNDMMSYAYPYWISAYTYRELAERVAIVSSYGSPSPGGGGDLGAAAEGDPRSLNLVFTADGSVHQYVSRGWPKGLQSGGELGLRVELRGATQSESRALKFAPKRGPEGEIRGLVIPLGEHGPNAWSAGELEIEGALTGSQTDAPTTHRLVIEG